MPLETTDWADVSEPGQTFSRLLGVWAAVLACSTFLLFAALLAGTLQ
jgi:hypothetical protein